MATKRVTPAKKTVKRKTTSAIDGAVPPIPETAGAEHPAALDPETRRQLIAAEAYFLAERRGFAGGNELEDWVAAEAVVDSRLLRAQLRA